MTHKPQLHRSALRPAAVYTLVVWLLSAIAGFHIENNDSPWALLFVMNPTLMTIVLRATHGVMPACVSQATGAGMLSCASQITAK